MMNSFSFTKYMDEVNKSPAKDLLTSNTTLLDIQASLAKSVANLSTPFLSESEQQKFSKTIRNLIQDKAFLSKFSDQTGEPLEDESEDDFVKRSSNTLRQMFYSKLGMK
jgi:hypothetical protein